MKKIKSVGGATAEEAALALRSEKTGLRAFDQMMQVIPFTNNKFGILKIGEQTVGAFNKYMRHGDLGALFRMNKIKVALTSVDEKMFRETMVGTPEYRSHNIDVLSNNAKKSHPHLDVKAKDIDAMPESTKADVAKMEKTAKLRFGTQVKIVLFIGVVGMGNSWIQANLKARRGCHMSTNIDGKITSCKIEAHTCLEPVTGSTVSVCGGQLVREMNLYNVTLVLMHLANMADNENQLKVLVCAAAKVEPETMSENLLKIIDNHYKTVSDVIALNKDKIPTFSPCADKHKDIENGVIPVCRMCSPSADPLSTSYIDPSQYADNITLECIPDPSVLDVVSDFITTTGYNILSKVASTLWTLTKPLLYIIGALAAVLALVLIGFSMFKNNQRNKLIESRDRSASTTSLTEPLLASTQS